jgi:hypothetical protein
MILILGLELVCYFISADKAKLVATIKYISIDKLIDMLIQRREEMDIISFWHRACSSFSVFARLISTGYIEAQRIVKSIA